LHNSHTDLPVHARQLVLRTSAQITR